MRDPIKKTTMAALFAAGLLALGACALTSKADLIDIRYFSPERVKPQLHDQAPPAVADEGARRVRLGRVSSGSSLRERIAFRNAQFELGYYEELRWTEHPEAYVRRGLGRSLFETHGLHRVFSGPAPTLEVEVLAFDDLRSGSGRSARVQLRIVLYEESGVMLENTLTVDRPVAGDTPQIEDVVAAMADALDAAVEEVFLRVDNALSERRAAGPAEHARDYGSGRERAPEIAAPSSSIP